MPAGPSPPVPITDSGAEQDADAPIPKKHFCETVSGERTCIDFEKAGSTLGTLFSGTKVASPSDLALELESLGVTNHVLRVRNVNAYAWIDLGGTLAKPIELRFRLRVEDDGGDYCIIGSLANVYGPGQGGAQFGVAVHTPGSLGPVTLGMQRPIDGTPGIWHDAVVRFQGDPIHSYVSIDDTFFSPESTAMPDLPPFGEARFGTSYCAQQRKALIYAVDNIVIYDR